MGQVPFRPSCFVYPSLAAAAAGGGGAGREARSRTGPAAASLRRMLDGDAGRAQPITACFLLCTLPFLKSSLALLLPPLAPSSTAQRFMLLRSILRRLKTHSVSRYYFRCLGVLHGASLGTCQAGSMVIYDLDSILDSLENEKKGY